MSTRKYKKYSAIIKKFPQIKILVIGDLMVDKFIYGSVSRISPEAPVPVVEVKKEVYMPGGAGNVANNIASLNSKVYLVGVIGNDITGKSIIETLKNFNINTDGIFIDNSRPTTIKTRLIAHHQQVVRFDKESKDELQNEVNCKILNYVEEVAKNVNAIIISDYGKGVINKTLINKVISIAKNYHLPVCVDPKIEHFLLYKKTTLITPNLQEATSGMRFILKSDSNEEIKNLGIKILNKLKCNSVVITLGERGMAIFEQNKEPVFLPTAAKEVFDVTGAGDTVIAVLTMAIASGASIIPAAEIANLAAGIVVGKLGTATVSTEELKAAIS